jgi:sugar lactone lactonase YvrE
VSALSAPEPVEAVLRRPHSLLEGPRIGPGGELVYSDVIAGGVFSCSTDGVVSELLARRRGVGGIVPHADGGWVLSGRSVIHLSPDGDQRELLSDPEAPGYNDLFSGTGGELLAGELRYRPMSGEEPREGRVVSLAGDGAPRTLCEPVRWANGIGLSPDGATLYVSDYARQEVLACPAGGGEPRRLAASPRGSADGLAVDAEGCLWLALGEGGGVARLAPEGELLEIVAVPARFVSSVSFGGEDGRDVLISTADNLIDPDLGGMLLRARSAVAGVTVTPISV